MIEVKDVPVKASSRRRPKGEEQDREERHDEAEEE